MINVHPVQGLLEQIENADPRFVSDEAIREFAARVSRAADRLSRSRDGEDRAALEELEYGAECVAEHYTPASFSALDQHRHNQDVRRKLALEEAV